MVCSDVLRLTEFSVREKNDGEKKRITRRPHDRDDVRPMQTMEPNWSQQWSRQLCVATAPVPLQNGKCAVRALAPFRSNNTYIYIFVAVLCICSSIVCAGAEMQYVFCVDTSSTIGVHASACGALILQVYTYTAHKILE